MKREGVCNDIYGDNCSKKGQVQVVSEHDEFICQACGDTLSVVKKSSIHKLMNKLKSPISALIMVGTTLLGGGAYYCFTGDSCFGSDEKTITQVIEKDQSIEEKSAWEQAKSLEELELFVQKYPNSLYCSNAEIKIDNLKKEKVEADRVINEREENQRFSLTVTTSPRDARVSITNIRAQYYDGIALRKGKYDIKISKSGYVTQRFSVDLSNDRSIDKTLEKEPEKKFSLTVNTTPSNATVSITNIGPKYYDGIALKKGTYDIKVSKSGYFTKRFSVDLSNDRNIDKTLEKEPEKKFSLTINTIPSNARVSITNIKSKYYDGIALKKGTYNIKISKSGYVTQRFSVDLNENKRLHRTLEKTYVPPLATRYSLTIDTIPSNAYVSNNSGVVFNNGAKLSRGSYSFTISKNGYYSKNISVFLNKNMRRVVQLTRKRIVPPPPPPKSECTKMLDRIQGNSAASILDMAEFNQNARNCTQAEKNRAKEIEKNF